MKYFETCYEISKPIEFVFDKIIDVADLHENIRLFGKGYFTTNEHAANELGKTYSIVNNQGNIAIRCILTLVKFDKPNFYELSYKYELKNENGEIEKGCPFLPWESMTCVVSFQEKGGSTIVTTYMHAHGVKSFFGKLCTKYLGVYNKFQQLKYNRRTSRYLASYA